MYCQENSLLLSTDHLLDIILIMVILNMTNLIMIPFATMSGRGEGTAPFKHSPFGSPPPSIRKIRTSLPIPLQNMFNDDKETDNTP